ncbi:hypothetical protein HOLleu_06030 [Holothuria leucospilota]|uniref:Uncharacterized protein n=1 Tax=Holothuria leucospilota TaxID=206669 RepID=A0A9Q1CM94_HOLLE|nr:hypothetical protein HOLleu_06030 [Holothuria leucospilota]
MESLQKTCIFFFLNLVTFLLPSFVESCTCPPSTQSFEMNFCLADYSYKGTIVNVEVVSDEGTVSLYYDVIVDEVYHGMEVVDAGSRIEVTTGLSGSECGMPGLAKGIYLFQGKGSPKEVSFCDFVKPLAEVSSAVQDGLTSGDYSRICAYFYDNICLVTARPEVTMEETTRASRLVDMEFTTADSI